MKVFQILYYPGQGGAEKNIFLISKYALKDGNEVEFIFGKEGPFVEKARSLGCKVHFIKMRSPLDPIAIYNLYKLFKSRKPDVVHTHFLRENFLSIVAGRLAGVRKIVSTVHRVEPKTPLQALFNKLFSNKLDRFIAVSLAAQSYLEHEGVKKDKIVVIENGVELKEKLLQNQDGKFRIGYAGRLAEEKNLSCLISAYAETKTKEKTELVLAGDGPERGKLEDLAQKLDLKNVSFLGQLEDMETFYSSLNMFVLP